MTEVSRRGSLHPEGSGAETGSGLRRLWTTRAARTRSALLWAAAALTVAAIFLPLWGMTLVSVQYPEGLRMVIYPREIVGDIAEINVLNHYIGMAEISNDYFAELQILPMLFAVIAVSLVAAALVRRLWLTALPLVLMAGVAGYGFWSMQRRLYQFGNDLDPQAAIDIEPFTPPMLGEHVIAQFGTYAYFSWGTLLPMIAGALTALALWLDVRARRGEPQPTHGGSMPSNTIAALALLLLVGGCAGDGAETGSDAAAAPAAPAEPTPGELEYAELTAEWSPEALQGCGPVLKETLGTRDLVQGALDGVKDPEGKATVEIEDARHWMGEGTRKIEEVRPRLAAGACDGDVTLALDEAVQFFVKAGTSAVQAGQIAGS